MRMVWLNGFILFASPGYAEIGFDGMYERDYNIFNPLNQHRPDNLLNPINSVDPNNPLDPIDLYNPVLRADRPKHRAGSRVMD
jgi:hypothetical protein